MYLFIPVVYSEVDSCLTTGLFVVYLFIPIVYSDVDSCLTTGLFVVYLFIAVVYSGGDSCLTTGLFVVYLFIHIVYPGGGSCLTTRLLLICLFLLFFQVVAAALLLGCCLSVYSCCLSRWWQLPYYWVGIKAYDLVAGSKTLKSSYVLSKSKALELFPMLKKDKLVGAIVYYDGKSNNISMVYVLHPVQQPGSY